MRNEFMSAARRAQVGVRSAQQRHEKWRAKADRRFTAAEALHASAVARAEMTEARAWMDLLAVPGVTIPTAAALMNVSESTVSRWVARYNRGLEEERATGGGCAVSAPELPAAVGSALPRSLFTAEEAAAALSVSETLVRQLTLTGELPCRRIGRLVRYAPADIEAFVKCCDQHGYAPRSRIR